MRTQGVSALDAATPVLAALRDLETRRNQDVDPVVRHLDMAYPLSIGVVRAGDWASTVPDLLIAEGRYGVRIGESVEPPGRSSRQQSPKHAPVTRGCRLIRLG